MKPATHVCPRDAWAHENFIQRLIGARVDTKNLLCPVEPDVYYCGHKSPPPFPVVQGVFY